MPKKKNKFKAVVIGCGNIGADESKYNKKVSPGTHAGAYNENDEIDLVAMMDVDQKSIVNAKKSFPSIKYYKDLHLMLKENNPDIVSIATPSKYHFQNVLEVAKYNVPIILCEKPIAYSIAEAKKMVSVCKKNSSQLFINHQRHFDPILNKWAKKVRAGLLGKLYQGNIYYYNGLFNNGTHAIDLMRMFLGDPIAIFAKENKATSNKKDDPNIDGLLFFKDDLKVSLQSLSENYGYFAIRMYGEKGMINITNLGFEVQYRKKIGNKNFKGFFELSSQIIKEGSPRSMFPYSAKHIVSFLRGKEKPISTGEDGLNVLKILETLKSSANFNGKEIKINY